MVNTGLVMEVTEIIKAPIGKVWECLMDPKKSAEVFFGISFESDLKKGSRIVWRGEWEGKPFEDGGVILDIVPQSLFRYEYHSSTSGHADLPELRQIISYRFEQLKDGVRLTIRQENTESEESKQRSAANWTTMLQAIKQKLES